jgi:RNA polymerase sigma-70 factor (ECF subfamily)
VWNRREPFLSGADAVRVRRVLFLNGVRSGEIEDAMQEIELRALQHPPRGKARGAWACAVATNLAMDAHRRAARDDEVMPAMASPVVAGEADGVVLRDAVRAGLDRLGPELRATVVLRFFADFSIPQIAAAMTLPEGTVKSRLHRAVSELRATLPVGLMR